MADNSAKGKPLPKTAVYKEIASKTELEPRQVQAVFEALEELIKEQLGKGAGVFQLQDLVKLELERKAATKAGSKPNPFKPGEMMEVKAKPASVKVKARILKGLRELE
jgi:nucleoid DNA-binding protein